MSNKIQLWFIYLYPISYTCFGRCFRPSSGALDCIYSFWYSPPMLLSGEVFAHQQEHLTVFTVSVIVHLCCCRPVSWTKWN